MSNDGDIRAVDGGRTIHGIAVAPRTIPHVLTRLAADQSRGMWEWRLGHYGSCELRAFPSRPPGVTVLAQTTGALHSADRSHSCAIDLAIHHLGSRTSELVLTVPVSPGEWPGTHPDAFAELRHAAVVEIGEELLYYAARLRTARV
jgi:hypothetical protein